MGKALAKNGFTLIEVILSMTILASMMVLVSISISRASKAKVKIQSEIESVSTLRDVMRIIRSDINQAYNHYDFEQEITDLANKKTVTSPNQQVQNAPTNGVGVASGQASAPSLRKSPATFFIGTEDSLNFVTMNNGRISANDAQADFVEVGYFLKNCKTAMGDGGRGDEKKSQGSQCLFRRVQKIIDSDITKGGDEVAILEDITEFSLKYLVEDKLDWLKTWKAEKKRYNIFPDAVEVTLGIEKEYAGKLKKYSLQYVVPIHFPNNIKAALAKPSTGTTTVDGAITQ